MKITLLGTGTPTNPHRFQSAVLVETKGQYLLFDAGRGAVHQLHQIGAPMNRIYPVFITHHHFDHINDLFDVIVSSAMNGRHYELAIFGPQGTKRIVRALLEEVYASDIRFRILEKQEIQQRGGRFAEQPQAISMVDVQDVGAGLVYEARGCRVTAAYVRHGDFEHIPDFNWRCLGYRIESEGKSVAISGDTVLCEGILTLAQDADLLVQCCHMPQRLVNNTAMAYLAESILPTSTEAGRIAAQAGVRKMVLTHLSATINEETYGEVLADIRENFAGQVLIGEDLMAIEF